MGVGWGGGSGGYPVYGYDPIYAAKQKQKEQDRLFQQQLALEKARNVGTVSAPAVSGVSAGGNAFSYLTPAQLQKIADPFGDQRTQYQNQLSALMANPGSFTSSPAYKFAYDQGLEAVNRSLAAKHLLGSGNRLTALTQYGQGMASQQYNTQAQLLAKLAGVDSSSPSAAAGAVTQARGQDLTAANNAAQLSLEAQKANQQNALGYAQLDASKTNAAASNTLATNQLNLQMQQYQDELKRLKAQQQADQGSTWSYYGIA